jgi:tetratricopeptide (TPR) repeat protein
MRAVIIGAFCMCVIWNACTCKHEKKQAQPHTGNGLPQPVMLLQQHVQQYSDSPSLRLQLAYSLDSLGHYKEAILHIDTLLANDSANYGLWFSKAQIEEEAKDTAAAIHSYQMAIQIYSSPDALLSLANLYAETKNKQALTLCNQVKELSMGRLYDAHCAFISGVYYARTGNKQKAIEYFNECIAHSYTYMEAYLEKGFIFFDEAKYRQALEIFQFASTVNNLYADAYYWMARCYEMMGMKDSAALRFQQSFTLDSSLVEAKTALARLAKE